MTRKFLTGRKLLTLVASLIVGLTGAAGPTSVIACPLQGGQVTQRTTGGGVPRINNLPPLAAGSNFPIVVEAVATKQTTPIKILSTSTTERQVVKIPTPPVATPVTPPVDPSDVSPIPTIADALARR